MYDNQQPATYGILMNKFSDNDFTMKLFSKHLDQETVLHIRYILQGFASYNLKKLYCLGFES